MASPGPKPVRQLTPAARLIELEHGRPLWDVLVLLRRQLGDQGKVAKRLGITRETLHHWLRDYYAASAADLDTAAQEQAA